MEIFIKHTELSDAGVYICTAKNPVGQSQKVYYLTVTELPKITSNFQNITLKTGESRNISCMSTGSPEPKIMWRINGQIISESSILNLNSSFESGLYDCYSVNSEGFASKSFSLEVLMEPTLIENADQIENSLEIKENDELELICPFENYIDVLWITRNDTHEIISGAEKIDNKLIISNVNPNVHGNISCLATNLAGNKTFNYNINVLHAPKILSDFELSNDINGFLNYNSDIEEVSYKVGETLILNCSALGNPMPKVNF